MAVALFYEDQGTFGGAIQANPTGFTWSLVGVFRDPGTGRKEVITGIPAQTLDADTLTQIRDKLAAAVKAEGAKRGFDVTTVVFFPLNTLAV